MPFIKFLPGSTSALVFIVLRVTRHHVRFTLMLCVLSVFIQGSHSAHEVRVFISFTNVSAACQAGLGTLGCIKCVLEGGRSE